MLGPFTFHCNDDIVMVHLVRKSMYFHTAYANPQSGKLSETPSALDKSASGNVKC